MRFLNYRFVMDYGTELLRRLKRRAEIQQEEGYGPKETSR